MNVIMLNPMQEAVVEEIDGSLEGMQEIVGGRIEAFYPFDDIQAAIIVNEEGKILGLPSNRLVCKNHCPIDILVGTAFICGCGEEEFCDLTIDQIDTLMPMIHLGAIHC